MISYIDTVYFKNSGDEIVTSTSAYWTEFQATNGWTIVMSKIDGQLSYVGINQNGLQHMQKHLEKIFPSISIIHQNDLFSKEIVEIEQYLKGEQLYLNKQDYSVGTEFQRKVWSAVCSVPYGKTATYTDIAREIGSIKSVRAVATAIGRNPLLLYVPCHRVIGVGGALSGYRDGVEIKKALLKMEERYIDRELSIL